jgi:hypothetical protein
LKEVILAVLMVCGHHDESKWSTRPKIAGLFARAAAHLKSNLIRPLSLLPQQ